MDENDPDVKGQFPLHLDPPFNTFHSIREEDYLNEHQYDMDNEEEDEDDWADDASCNGCHDELCTCSKCLSRQQNGMSGVGGGSSRGGRHHNRNQALDPPLPPFSALVRTAGTAPPPPPLPILEDVDNILNSSSAAADEEEEEREVEADDNYYGMGLENLQGEDSHAPDTVSPLELSFKSEPGDEPSVTQPIKSKAAVVSASFSEPSAGGSTGEGEGKFVAARKIHIF